MFEIQPLSSLDGKPEGSDEEEPQIYDLIIMGAGPAGLTAAIYTGRARISTLVLTGTLPGGQPVNTDVVENYPGFPEGIAGPDLAQLFQSQAGRFGARMKMDTVTKVDLLTTPFTVHTHSASYQGQTVIVATGAVPRRLGVPGEDGFFGRGVSACAVCDGALPHFRDRVIAIVGGGDSALEDALYMTKFASEVVVIHRRDELRASKIMQDRAFENPKIRFLWNTVVTEVVGDEVVERLLLANRETGEASELGVGGLFVAIGHEPNTEFLAGQVELEPSGYIRTPTSWRTETSVAGVFAAGDSMDAFYRQAITAAGTGCMAALEAERWLAHG